MYQGKKMSTLLFTALLLNRVPNVRFDLVQLLHSPTRLRRPRPRTQLAPLPLAQLHHRAEWPMRAGAPRACHFVSCLSCPHSTPVACTVTPNPAHPVDASAARMYV